MNTTTQLVNAEDIAKAQKRLAGIVEQSPLSRCWRLSTESQEVSFKWDNRLPTGSFKERGAAHMLLSLSEEQKKQGVIAASAGNHALALSYHASKLGISCQIVMPQHAPLVKVSSSKAYGAEVLLHGATFDEAVAHCEAIAAKSGRLIIPAFNHPTVIAGQGVAGLEILEQAPQVDTLYVPVGGGGLLSGIAVALKTRKPSCRIVGVQSEWALHSRSDKAHQDTSSTPLALRPMSIADGIAVKTQGPLTSTHLDKYVDEFITVSEDQIASAILWFLEHEHSVVEGAGAAGLAGYLADSKKQKGASIVIEVCGSNIDMNLLGRLIERHWSLSSRLLDVSVSVPDRPGSLNALTEIIAALGGNVMRVNHDRSFAQAPGNVNIQLVVEVSDQSHRQTILDALSARGVTPLTTQRK